jgi:hypothetical protein
MYIVVDFDGSVVTHDFPRMGKDIGSVPTLKKLVENGHQLILFTMRSKFLDKKSGDVKDTLTPAVQWFKDNDIELFGIQTNPTQGMWTQSPKAYGELIIDDAAFGCPLKMDKNLSDRPFIDWVVVEKGLIEMNLIK